MRLAFASSKGPLPGDKRVRSTCLRKGRPSLEPYTSYLALVILCQRLGPEKLGITESLGFALELGARSMRRFLGEHQCFVNFASSGHDRLDLIEALNGSHQDTRFQDDVLCKCLFESVSGFLTECFRPNLRLNTIPQRSIVCFPRLLQSCALRDFPFASVNERRGDRSNLVIDPFCKVCAKGCAP